MKDIKWDKEAEQALAGVPFFVRAMVRKKVSERVAGNGGGVVTIADFRKAEEKFRAVMGGKSEKELKAMLPADNIPGVEMVLIEACHNELSGCPNVLIKTVEWKTAIEGWVRTGGINEQLRRKTGENKILFHHKLKISISGCPNGCSRPQIADIGIVGFVKPDADPENCTLCGACEEACPDEAITLNGTMPVFNRLACQGCLQCSRVCPNKCISISSPGARVLVGGKLGRHPRLGRVEFEAATPADLIPKLDAIVREYIESGKPGERFADFRIRTKGR